MSIVKDAKIVRQRDASDLLLTTNMNNVSCKLWIKSDNTFIPLFNVTQYTLDALTEAYNELQNKPTE